MQTSVVAASGLSSCGSLSSASSPKEGGGRTRDLHREQGTDDTRKWQHPSERCSNNGGWLQSKGPEGSQAPAGGAGTVSSKRRKPCLQPKGACWEREKELGVHSLPLVKCGGWGSGRREKCLLSSLIQPYQRTGPSSSQSAGSAVISGVRGLQTPRTAEQMPRHSVLLRDLERKDSARGAHGEEKADKVKGAGTGLHGSCLPVALLGCSHLSVR